MGCSSTPLNRPPWFLQQRLAPILSNLALWTHTSRQTGKCNYFQKKTKCKRWWIFDVDVTLDGNAEERQSGVTGWKHVNFVKTGTFNRRYITQYARCPHIVQIPILNSLLSITKVNGYSLTSLLVSPSKKFSLYAIKHFISLIAIFLTC